MTTKGKIIIASIAGYMLMLFPIPAALWPASFGCDTWYEGFAKGLGMLFFLYLGLVAIAIALMGLFAPGSDEGSALIGGLSAIIGCFVLYIAVVEIPKVKEPPKPPTITEKVKRWIKERL